MIVSPLPSVWIILFLCEWYDAFRFCFIVSFSSIAMAMGRGHRIQPTAVQPGSIATVSGYGAYANIAAPQQVVLPQGAQYAAGMLMSQIFQE